MALLRGEDIHWVWGVMPQLGPRWMLRHRRRRSPGGRPLLRGGSSLGNAKGVGWWCMSQQNVVGSYQHAAEFGRASSQGGLTDRKEVELTLTLLFNSFLFNALNSFSVWLLNGASLGGSLSLHLPDGCRAMGLCLLDRTGTDGFCFLDKLCSFRIILLKSLDELLTNFLPMGINRGLDC